MSNFSKRAVNYNENRADGGFAWQVRYDLTFAGKFFEVDLKVALTGADSSAVRAEWLAGINTAWNNRAFFSDGVRLYPVTLDFDFVSSGQHQTVNVHAGTGRSDIVNWWQQADFGLTYNDETAAHEVGHMLGNFDEYSGGATYQGRTFTGSLMADLTYAGFERYYFSVEFFAESFANHALSTNLAVRGSSRSETLTGNSAMNGFYGFGGNDKINGLSGNDYLDGGGQNDLLNGGLGRDTLVGGVGSDAFVFNFALSAARNLDTITDYNVRADTIWIDNAIFRGVTGAERHHISTAQFYKGAAAHDRNDHIIYNPASGALIYDSNGSAAGGAVQFALLSKGLALTAADILVV